ASGRTDYQRFKGLKEWNFGRMEGQQEYLHPNRRPDQQSHEDFYLLYDGDGEEEIQSRISQAISGIFQEMKEGQTALAVSHV
ncbi:histidine phosphatase family protein, partial [Streptococcus pyogenes]